MKKYILLIISLLFFIYILNYDDNQVKTVKLSDDITELKEKYPIKPYHEKISLKCIHCHEGQGDEPMKFTYVDDEKCYECHGDERKIAQRTSYKNALFSNPHDSMHKNSNEKIHCNDCHHAHEPSENSCAECHPSKAFQWMKEFPE